MATKIIGYIGYTLNASVDLTKLTEGIWQVLTPTSSTNMTLKCLDDGAMSRATAVIASLHAASKTCTFQLYAPWDTTGTYNTIFTNTAIRDVLFDQIHNIFNAYAFDGVNFDWECDNRPNVTAAQVTTFYQALYNYLAVNNPGKTISATENGSPIKVTMTTAVQPYLDWIGLMVYDMGSPHYGTIVQVAENMNAWVTAGFAKTKMILGITFYALLNNSWGAGSKTYAQIIDDYNPTPDLNVTNSYYYNGHDLVVEKAQWVADNLFDGVFVYTTNVDKFSAQSLLLHIYDTLVAETPLPPPLEPPASTTLVDAQSKDIQPYIACIFKNKAGSTIVDYSFDPTLSTNRIEELIHYEEPFDSSAPTSKIVLRNNDRVVPELRETYVDIGYGANVVGTGLLKVDKQRLWVKAQNYVSGGPQSNNINSKDKLKILVELESAWRHFLNITPVRIGTSPLFKDESSVLRDKTIYGVLEYLIETGLSTQTGYNFFLAPLGDHDDGLINNPDYYIPFPTAYEDPPTNSILRTYINPYSPGTFDTYRELIEWMMSFTMCQLRTDPNLVFTLVLPKKGESANESYYSNQAHYFYENREIWNVLNVNHFITYCNKKGNWNITGNAYSDDDWDLTVSPYALKTGKTERIASTTIDSITTALNADKIAAVYLAKARTQTFGGRIVVPHDARVELYDKVDIFDYRGT